MNADADNAWLDELCGRRVAYPAAGRAQRQAIRRARAQRCGLEEQVTLGAVMALTTTYSKLAEEVEVEEVAEEAGLHRTNATAALRSLRDKQVIGYRAARGPGARVRVGLPAAEVEKGVLAAPYSEVEKEAQSASYSAVRPEEKEAQSAPDKGSPIGSLLLACKGVREVKTEKKAKNNSSSSKVHTNGNKSDHELAGTAAADELRIKLQELGWREWQVEDGLADPGRARAWAERGEQEAQVNPGGYAWAGFSSGDDVPLTSPGVRYTGCRERSGTHGVSHALDPLGTDKPPADWPHKKPTQEEIQAAIAENGGSPIRRKLTPEEQDERLYARIAEHEKNYPEWLMQLKRDDWERRQEERCR